MVYFQTRQKKQLDTLFYEIILNSDQRSLKKCLVVYLKKKGFQRKEIAIIAGINEDSITNYVNKYDKSGLQGLLANNYRKPTSQLESYTDRLKELFNKQVPHTINQAIKMVEEETNIQLKPSACRAFLKKIGMKSADVVV